MSEKLICANCDGAGSLRIKHGVQVCPSCDGYGFAGVPNTDVATLRSALEAADRLAEAVDGMGYLDAAHRKALAECPHGELGDRRGGPFDLVECPWEDDHRLVAALSAYRKTRSKE